MINVVNEFLWVNDPTAEGSLLSQAFERSRATEMNGANAQQFSRAANDMFGEYTWSPLEVRTGIYVIAIEMRRHGLKCVDTIPIPFSFGPAGDKTGTDPSLNEYR